jgi:isochorismate hydrolase
LLLDYKSVILCGIEAHACVLSTCLDLLENNIDVHVIVDGVSSRSLVDRKYAFKRMKQSGAYLTTSESIMFQLCKDAAHPKFKHIQKLIKTSAPQSGLLNL